MTIRPALATSILFFGAPALAGTVTLTATTGEKLAAQDSGGSSTKCALILGKDEKSVATVTTALAGFRTLGVVFTEGDGATSAKIAKAGLARLAKTCKVDPKKPGTGITLVGIDAGANIGFSIADESVVNGVLISPAASGDGVKITAGLQGWGLERPLMIWTGAGDTTGTKIASIVMGKAGFPQSHEIVQGANDTAAILKSPATMPNLVSWITGTHELLLKAASPTGQVKAETEDLESTGTRLEDMR